MYLINRFFMKFYPEYFSLSDEEKLIFRMKNLEEISEKFEQFFLSEKYNVDTTKEDYDDILQDDVLFEYNKHTVYLRGIGDNYFYLNESLDEEGMLKFRTLYDYDYDDFVFQSKCIHEYTEEENKNKGIETPEFKIPDYVMRLYANWARCVWKEENGNDKFYYLILNSLSAHVYMDIEEAIQNKISELIPHEYVPGKDHGKKSKGGFSWNMEIDANGKEKFLEELRLRSYTYLKDIYKELQEKYELKKYNSTWIIKKEDDPIDPSMTIIFSDKNVIKNINFETFQKNVVDNMKQPFEIIENEIKEEVEKANNFIESQYKDIIENFDPKIVKLKKKRKIIISDEALNDIFKDL